MESHRFQKLDDNLQDDTMVATMALSLLARRWVKPYIYLRHISIKLGTQLETNIPLALQLRLNFIKNKRETV